MKKITMIMLFVCGAFTVSMAQTTSAPPNSTVSSKQDKAAMAAQKKADRQAQALAKKQAKPSDKVITASPAISEPSTSHLNKNGTPDKRFKANNPPTSVNAPTQAQATVPSNVPPATSVTTNKATNHMARATTAKVADKSIGTDAQGRTIYQGPRGGKYYINKNGNKEYVK